MLALGYEVLDANCIQVPLPCFRPLHCSCEAFAAYKKGLVVVAFCGENERKLNRHFFCILYTPLFLALSALVVKGERGEDF